MGTHGCRTFGLRGLEEDPPIGSAAEHVDATDAQGGTQYRLHSNGDLPEREARRGHLRHRHGLERRTGHIPRDGIAQRRLTGAGRQARVPVGVDEVVAPGSQGRARELA